MNLAQTALRALIYIQEKRARPDEHPEAYAILDDFSHDAPLQSASDVITGKEGGGEREAFIQELEQAVFYKIKESRPDDPEGYRELSAFIAVLDNTGELGGYMKRSYSPDPGRDNIANFPRSIFSLLAEKNDARNIKKMISAAEREGILEDVLFGYTNRFAHKTLTFAPARPLNRDGGFGGALIAALRGQGHKREGGKKSAADIMITKISERIREDKTQIVSKLWENHPILPAIFYHTALCGTKEQLQCIYRLAQASDELKDRIRVPYLKLRGQTDIPLREYLAGACKQKNFENKEGRATVLCLLGQNSFGSFFYALSAAMEQGRAESIDQIKTWLKEEGVFDHPATREELKLFLIDVQMKAEGRVYRNEGVSYAQTFNRVGQNISQMSTEILFDRTKEWALSFTEFDKKEAAARKQKSREIEHQFPARLDLREP
ncbi:MAG: hypothetical protein H6861_03095 [Rhodospirillales bacterium]|nr:hypothetical protein [Rhodospirillales bacterium]